MKPDYVIARIIRRALPESFTRFLLRHGWIIKPGLETREPTTAAKRYANMLEEHGESLTGKRVLVFGYGGRFSIGIELLQLGAAAVVMTDLFAPPDDRRNDHLLPEFNMYLERIDGRVVPHSDNLTLRHGDIRYMQFNLPEEAFDLVVSTSVYEHLEDVSGITTALANLLKPGGCFIAYIDLRDHFFKYPFAMLTYKESIWRQWLNPTSNLNRYRFEDYQRILKPHFSSIDWNIIERDLPNFLSTKQKILPEFLSGDDQMDAITQISVFACR